MRICFKKAIGNWHGMAWYLCPCWSIMCSDQSNPRKKWQALHHKTIIMNRKKIADKKKKKYGKKISPKINNLETSHLKHSFKIQFGLINRFETRTRPGWKKIRKKKTRYDLAGWSGDPIRLSQKPGCNPLTFFFLLKRRRFDF
jgi:hypothetical protein